MIRIALVFCALSSFACATRPTYPAPGPGPSPRLHLALEERDQAQQSAAEGAYVAPMDVLHGIEVGPQAYAAQFDRSDRCERGARALQGRSKDLAWDVLKACVAKGDFIALRGLLSGAWDDDLAKRPEAMELIAQVIAGRGGNVAGDLSLLHKKRVPVFALADAVRRPDIYRGKLVVLRAQVALTYLQAPEPSVRLTELTLGSELQPVEVRPSYDRTWRSSGYYGDTRYGSRSESSYTTTVKRAFNVELPSGLEALGRTERPDPFLSGEQVYIVLARFDGLSRFPRAGLQGEESLPVLSIL
jgi:hypothetical protein